MTKSNRNRTHTFLNFSGALKQQKFWNRNPVVQETGESFRV